jgi:hypothetical protein
MQQTARTIYTSIMRRQFILAAARKNKAIIIIIILLIRRRLPLDHFPWRVAAARVFRLFIIYWTCVSLF